MIHPVAPGHDLIIIIIFCRNLSVAKRSTRPRIKVAGITCQLGLICLDVLDICLCLPSPFLNLFYLCLLTLCLFLFELGCYSYPVSYLHDRFILGMQYYCLIHGQCISPCCKSALQFPPWAGCIHQKEAVRFRRELVNRGRYMVTAASRSACILGGCVVIAFQKAWFWPSWVYYCP